MSLGKAGWRSVRLGAALLMTVPLVVLTGAPSQAEASFTSHADSQVFHVTVSNDMGSIPTLPQVDAGIGTASVTFSSFGGGVARAASPDAGSAASVPALLGVLVPSLIPFPLPFALPSVALPGDITVQSGQKPAKVATGPYHLNAAVTETSASATAALGASLDDDNGALQTLSNASVTVGDDGSVTAAASSSVNGLKINGLIGLGEVTSKAAVVRDADGTIHRSSSTSVDLLKVAGLTLSFQNGVFVTPVGALPVPLDTVTQLVTLLTGGMVDIRVLPAKETPNGIVAGGLQIIQTVPPPKKCIAIPLPTPIVSGVTYCGTTTVVYDLGKASVSTDYAAIPDPETPSSEPSTPADTSSEPPAAAPVIDELPLQVPGTSSIDVPLTTVPDTGSVVDSPALLAVRARFVDMSNIYLAVAGLAILLLISSTCLRLLGVRNKWTS